ncbi:MAG: Hpt domain-containing protein, partial [Gammaproteobacteria bacterium]|nr:Hpt domain-containing protein [Gammaproteobacteria bacterium]
VLDAFLESIDDLLASLKSRSVDESNETIWRWAHSIKSSAASIGMMKLATIARTLEEKLKQGLAVDVDLLVSQIEDEYNLGRELLNSR